MRIIPLTLLAALSFHAQAQLWEVADQRNEEVYLSKVLPVGGGRWAVIGRAAWAGSHMISVRNGDGTIAWEQVSPYGTSDDVGEVVLMPDSGLLQVGLYDGCDFFPDSRACRFAPDGTILWERVFSSDSFHPFTMAAKGATDHVAVASEDSVCVLDMSGTLVSEFHVPSSNIQGILWSGDSSLFIVKGNDLQRVDLDGNMLSSTTIGSPVVDMHWDGQQLFVLADDSVRRFSMDLVPAGSTAFPDPTSSFIVSDSALYVNAVTGLFQLAADGSSTLLFPWPALPGLVPTGCAVRDSTVLSVGDQNISGRSTGVIRSLSMTGDAAQHDQDVELLLQVDSTWTESITYPYTYWNWKADITGLVVNHALDTLRNVVLSMWVDVPSVLCEQPVNRIDATDLALAPGDTLSIPFGAVYVAQGLYASQAVGPGEICIVALAPDHLADRAPDDNTACGTYDFTLGIADRMHEAPLTLAPNPAVNTCVLSGVASLGAPVHVRIWDLTGRVVAERSITASSNNMEMDVSALPPATYILSAEGGNSRSMMKLVVARP